MSYQEKTKSIGERIRSERTRLGLDEVTYCEAVGIYPSVLHEHEFGKKEVTGTHLQQMAGLGFDINFIITGVHQSNANNLVAGEEKPATTLTLTSETGKSAVLWLDTENPEKVLEIAINYLKS